MSQENPALPDVRRLEEPRRLALPLPGAGAERSVEPPGHGVIDWWRIAGAVRRFKWVVVLFTVVGTAAGVGIGRLVDPVYTARTTLWVDAHDVRERDQGPIQTGELVGSSGWVDLLESHIVLDDVVRQQRLYLTLATPGDSAVLASLRVKENVRPGTYRLTVAAGGESFALTTDRGDTLQRGAAGDSVGADAGLEWVPPIAALPPGHTIEFAVASPDAVAARLSTQLKVQTDLLEGKVGNFIRVELRGTSPSGVPAVLNAVADRFVTVAADLRRQKLTELVNILGEQVRHAQTNLAAAEQALRDFRVGTVTFLSGDAAPLMSGAAAGRDPTFGSFFDMKVSREQVRLDRVALERVLAQQADSGLSTDALETIPSVQHSSALTQTLKELTEKQAELRALRYRYTEDHPPVRRLAADIATLERQGIPTMVRGLIAQLAAREAELGRRVDSAAGGLRQIPALAIQEARLQRDASTAAQLVANIQQRYEEARLAEVSSIPEVRVLDRAVQPQLPLFNAGPLLVAVAFLGSCLAGVLGAVVLDRIDPRVRHPDQVTQAMGLRILGAVPHVSRRAEGDGVASVIEALRGIRLRVVHAHGSAGPILVTITSPGRGDGKSFVSSNLALAFADAGYRTLLIDGDIRRGALHRVLGASRKPGLTELLAGGAQQEQVIQATSYPSLWFIGCGTRTQVGPELLTSAPMARLITSLRPNYDVILVDSPPLAAGIDAYALGTMTGSLLFVLRTGYSNREMAQAKLSYSNREMAQAKLNVLDTLPVRVLGAVLNDVRLGGEYRYYSYYLAGYEVANETGWTGRPVLRAPES